MPRASLPGPDPSSRNSAPETGPRGHSDDNQGHYSESDFDELASHFASLPPQLRAELALEIVLNEIVDQACAATGASGAAIALERDGELVCRASSGATAPELGSPLNTRQGLSGECIRTRQVQICDDAETDPRADPVAARLLGVRSVIVLPLTRGFDLIGVLEAFSTQAFAFAERDRHILGVLAHRVLKNVERAANWPPTAADGEASRVAALSVASSQDVPAPVVFPDHKTSADKNEGSFSIDPRLRSLAEAARSGEESPHLWQKQPEVGRPDAPGGFEPDAAGLRGDDLYRDNFGLDDLRPTDAGSNDAALNEADSNEADSNEARAEEATANNSASDVTTEYIEEIVKLIRPSPAVSVITWMLGAVVLISTIGLVVLGSERLIGHRADARSSATGAAGSSRSPVQSRPAPGPLQTPPPSSPSPAAKTGAAVPPGSLLVYDNSGKEVFRMLPEQAGAAQESLASPAQAGAVSAVPAALPSSSTGTVIERAASVESDPGVSGATQPQQVLSHQVESRQAQHVLELPPSEAEQELVRRVEPDYPPAARQQDIQGQVVLAVRIASDGEVEDLEVVSGQPLLVRAAMDAVRQWRFKPHTAGGRAVEMQTRVTLDFRLPH